jgi:predicted nuclease of predicted toxin-antitoxin system
MKLFASVYADENMHVLVPKYLRIRGFDATNAEESAMRGRSDREQLEFAVSQKRMIVTHDRKDFLVLHNEWLAAGRPHYGIVLTALRPPAEIAYRVAELLNRLTADELKNGLFYV